jgi:hypothetical protein
MDGPVWGSNGSGWAPLPAEPVLQPGEWVTYMGKAMQVQGPESRRDLDRLHDEQDEARDTAGVE